MSHVNPREHHERRLDCWPMTGDVEKPEVETPPAETRKLYGPKGEVLRTFSDKPPTGFHQGQRGAPRR